MITGLCAFPLLGDQPRKKTAIRAIIIIHANHTQAIHYAIILESLVFYAVSDYTPDGSTGNKKARCGPVCVYEARVKSGELTNDDFQKSVIQKLEQLHSELRGYEPPPPTTQSWNIFSKVRDEPEHIYRSMFNSIHMLTQPPPPRTHTKTPPRIVHPFQIYIPEAPREIRAMWDKQNYRSSASGIRTQDVPAICGFEPLSYRGHNLTYTILNMYSQTKAYFVLKVSSILLCFSHK